MSNDRKKANEGASADNDTAPDMAGATGRSQDAARHQKDAAHHKGYKGRTPAPSDGNVERQSQRGPGSTPK